MVIMLSTIKSKIRRSTPYIFFRIIIDFILWRARRFGAPSPQFIKSQCLIRNSHPNATWVETGTYRGIMTKVLSIHGAHVYSLEPEHTLFKSAQEYFSKTPNVEILNGTSENLFPTLLLTIKGDVNFWLDGHFSGGPTFKGSNDTPIREELKYISDNLSNFDKVCVLIDDVRCFNPQHPDYYQYPSLNYLVDWANVHNMVWHIEHDIFIAKK